MYTETSLITLIDRKRVVFLAPTVQLKPGIRLIFELYGKLRVLCLKAGKRTGLRGTSTDSEGSTLEVQLQFKLKNIM